MTPLLYFARSLSWLETTLPPNCNCIVLIFSYNVVIFTCYLKKKLTAGFTIARLCSNISVLWHLSLNTENLTRNARHIWHKCCGSKLDALTWSSKKYWYLSGCPHLRSSLRNYRLDFEDIWHGNSIIIIPQN